MKRLSLVVLFAALAVLAAVPRPALAARRVALEASGQFGLADGRYAGVDGNWIGRTPTVGGGTLGVRADRWVFGLSFVTASADTSYTQDPASGRPLLVGLHPVSGYTESVTTRFLLFTLRADLFTSPHAVMPYVLGGIGTGRLTERANGGTHETSLTNSVGRGSWTAGVGAESRPYPLPFAGRLFASAFVEGRYLARSATGETARRGYIARADEPYTSANNYYMARDNNLDEIDAPPDRLSYFAVTLGVKLGYGL